MVAGLKEGDRVELLAWRIKGQGWAKHNWPASWQTELLTGVCMRRINVPGISHRRWVVRWQLLSDNETEEKVHSSRSLERAGTATREAQATSDAGPGVLMDRNVVSNAQVRPTQDGPVIDEVEDNNTTNPLMDVREAHEARNAGPNLLEPHALPWVEYTYSG